jgi:hypothetical protein
MLDPNHGAATAYWEARRKTLSDAVKKLNATPATIPGLWNAPGYPELTTAQLLQIAGGTDE